VRAAAGASTIINGKCSPFELIVISQSSVQFCQEFASIRISQRCFLHILRAFAPPCRTFRWTRTATRTDYDPPSPFGGVTGEKFPNRPPFSSPFS
jgi:hypothetical protein